MAVVTPTINGYPVLEANVLKSRITGRIWSQYELDETDFATGKAYNGMILAIDDAAKSVKLPVGTTTANEVYALHFSAEAEYEHRGLNTFAVAREAVQNEPNVSVNYPRMFELSVGDVFHTNCVKLDGSNVTSINDASDTKSVKALISATTPTPVYGGINTDGFIMLNTAKPTVGPVLQVVAQDTLPNGDWAVKLVVRKA
jgi:hypothetical protein